MPVCMQVDGNLVRWQKWEFRVRFDAREGMFLHDVTFNHGGSATRPILHRASMPEMAVPYAETQAPFHRRMVFGEWPYLDSISWSCNISPLTPQPWNQVQQGGHQAACCILEHCLLGRCIHA